MEVTAFIRCTKILLSLMLFSNILVDALEGTATFYGGSDASGTNSGACGYSNVLSMGYGTMNSALSGTLFNGGEACGACYQLRCTSVPYGNLNCISNSIVVTATNLCPQGSEGGWCNAPHPHFDLAEPAFLQIAPYAAGVVHVQYERVTCSRNGGIHFRIDGAPYFLQVLVYNVAGAGDVTAVSVKGSDPGWNPLNRSWGQIWTTGSVYDGQDLSFSVTISDGRTVISNNVADSSWTYGQTFEGAQF